MYFKRAAACSSMQLDAPHNVTRRNKCRLGFFFPVRFCAVQVTTDPVGLYLYLLKALSDERHELLEDDRRFTDFVLR